MNVNIIRPSLEDRVPVVATPYVDVHGILDEVLKLILPSGSDVPPSNVILNSLHGLGKTLIANTLAVEAGKRLKKPVPLVVVECSEDTREYHLRGSAMQLPDGSTGFVLGPMPLAIELANEAGFCILNVEEISKLPPGTQGQFNAMTDWRRSVDVPQLGKAYRLNPGCHVVVVATMNPAMYGGVYNLNVDLRSRFNEYIVPLPDAKQEAKILKTVCPWADGALIENACRLAKDTRTDATEYKVSTRDLVQLLQNIRRLGNEKGPLQLLANKFEEGQERDLVKDRIKATFSVTVV